MASVAGDLAALPTDAPRTVVINKLDRVGGDPRIEQPDGAPAAGGGPPPPARLYLSASTGAGLELLRQHLKDCVGFHPAGEGVLSARTRHLDALRRARAHVEEAHRLLTARHAGELVAQELTDAQRALGEITGEVTSEELLGRIFGSFCIGK
jgi:tRNA modification GTPase